MKTIQKLELYSGIATVVAAILQILTFVFYSEQELEIILISVLVFGFGFLGFPTILICLGSYQHSTYGNKMGFAFVFLFGSIFIGLYGCLALLNIPINGLRLRDSTLFLIFWLLPSFLVGCTMLFALINAFWSSPKSNFY